MLERIPMAMRQISLCIGTLERAEIAALRVCSRVTTVSPSSLSAFRAEHRPTEDGERIFHLFSLASWHVDGARGSDRTCSSTQQYVRPAYCEYIWLSAMTTESMYVFKQWVRGSALTVHRLRWRSTCRRGQRVPRKGSL